MTKIINLKKAQDSKGNESFAISSDLIEKGLTEIPPVEIVKPIERQHPVGYSSYYGGLNYTRVWIDEVDSMPAARDFRAELEKAAKKRLGKENPKTK